MLPLFFSQDKKKKKKKKREKEKETKGFAQQSVWVLIYMKVQREMVFTGLQI